MFPNRTQHLGAWLSPVLFLAVLSACGSDPGPGRGSNDAATAPDGARADGAWDDGGSDDGGTEDDAAEEDAGDVSPPTLPVGARCTADGECLQGDCFEHQPDGYCSGACLSDGDCGPNAVCAQSVCYARCSPGVACDRPSFVCTTLASRAGPWGDSEPVYGCYARASVGGFAILPEGVRLVLTDAAGGTSEIVESGSFSLANRIPIGGHYDVSYEIRGDDISGVSCLDYFLDGTVRADVRNLEIRCVRRPPPPTDLGNACANAAACMRGVCLDQPGGYCSAACGVDTDCGGDDVCVSAACLLGCTSDADCTRAGYFCTYAAARLDADGDIVERYACRGGRTVGGTATIPAGVTVVVRDAAAGMISLTGSGAFTLPNRVRIGSHYAVTFETQGGVQGVSCVGESLEGQAVSDVTSVRVICGRQAVFTEPGTHAWVVPPGVTSVSVVAVGAGGYGAGNYGGGGGELCYQNAIPVTPGATIQVVVGNLGSQTLSDHHSSFNGTLVAHGGDANYNSVLGFVPGGSGGTVGTCFAGGNGRYNASSGGAAGYAGKGGDATGNNSPQAGAGGGGGGGAFSRPGGGVGLEGLGENGVAPGGNGSQANASVPVAGGGGTAYTGSLVGQNGGVRIIWGAGRSYPSQAGNL